MKKLLSKALAVVMAAALCVGMCATAFAAGTSADDTGSVTVNGLVEGVTASAYQIAKATYDDAGNFLGYEMVEGTEGCTFQIGSDGSYNESDLTEANLAALYAALNGATATGSAKADSNGVAEIVNLPVGSYLVVITGSESVVYGMMIGSVYYYYDSETGIVSGEIDAETGGVVGDQLIWAKATTPTVQKTEHHSNSNDGTHGETTNVGDEITFDITINNIPSYQGEYPEFEVDDVLTGLTISDDELENLTVKIMNGEVEIATLELNKDYTLTPVGDSEPYTEFDVNFVIHDEDENTYTYTLNTYAGLGYSIVIEYQATVTDEGVDYESGEAEHENEVTLTYSTTSYASGNDGKDDDKDYEYDFDMTFSKTDGNETPLAGATFGLYTDATCSTAYQQNGDDVTAVSDEDGTVEFSGLAEGTYYLKEISAPAGYMLDTAVYTVEISATINDETGELVSWTITITNPAGETVGTATSSADTGMTVINTTTSALPSTGGMGTTIFYIIGGVLVAGAVVVLVTRRRMNHEA